MVFLIVRLCSFKLSSLKLCFGLQVSVSRHQSIKFANSLVPKGIQKCNNFVLNSDYWEWKISFWVGHNKGSTRVRPPLPIFFMLSKRSCKLCRILWEGSGRSDRLIHVTSLAFTAFTLRVVQLHGQFHGKLGMLRKKIWTLWTLRPRPHVYVHICKRIHSSTFTPCVHT